MSETRVYLVADFEPLRVGLTRLIEAQPDLKLLGATRTMEEMASDDRFKEAHVIVIDADSFNRADLPTVYRKIGEWIPGLQLLFIGTESDARALHAEDIPMYMGLKAVGFVIKGGDGERLLQAIRLVGAGAFVCEMGVIRHILTRLTHWANEAPSAPQVGNLSGREVEVLTLVAQGRSNKEIAEELFVSQGTVKIHVSHIMTKLDLDRRTELVRFALASGLAPLG
jgi:DNA-binding NarL/FixJ family response regulator